MSTLVLLYCCCGSRLLVMTEPTVREGVNLGVELAWIHPQPSALQGVQCIYVTEYLQLSERMVTVVTLAK